MRPLLLFIAYSHSDDALRQELVKHLSHLKRQRLVVDWYDRLILPGSTWENVIDEHLENADIILLLVSADFLASDYCYQHEMARALERHSRGEAVVVPVLLRPVDWEDERFASVQMLPPNGKPVTATDWTIDEALTAVSKGIKAVVQDLGRRSPTLTAPNRAGQSRTPRRSHSFVGDVARVYQSLGYRVHQDETVCEPNQLVAEIAVRASPAARVLVCCDPRKRVADWTVFESLIRRYRAKASRHGLTGATYVTRGAPPKSAPPHASHDIRLLTFPRLLDEAINASVPLKEYMEWYERQDIYLSYLPLRCTILHETGSPDADEPDPPRCTQDAMATLRGWLDGPDRFLTVLGDFGTGKTTLLQRLKYELASEYIGDRSSLVPLYVPLRNFRTADTLDRFLETKVEEELHLRVSSLQIQSFLQQDRFLLLLDGFDEMEQQVDARKRRDNFRALLPVMLQSRKTILSCRPGYFLTHEELQSVTGQLREYVLDTPKSALRMRERTSHRRFLDQVAQWNTDDRRSDIALGAIQSLELCEFTTRDIDAYVADFLRRQGVTEEQEIVSMRKRLKATYDLEDLAKRPVLLNIIVHTLPSLPVDRDASPAIIYEAYTNSWMNHDYSKGEVRMLIPAAEKRGFMQVLAWQMYLSNVLSLHHTKLRPHLSNYFRAEDRIAEFIATDIQACSFLERDDNGDFRFGHKSFQEYFSAEYFRERLLSDDYSFLRVVLSDEIVFFLGDMIHSDSVLAPRFTSRFVSHENGEASDLNETGRHNLLRLVGAARLKISGLDAKRRHWKDTVFRHDVFKGRMHDCDWRRLTFRDCGFEELELRNLTYGDIVLDQCALSTMVFHGGKRIAGKAVAALRVLKTQGDRCDIDSIEGSCSESSFESSTIRGRYDMVFEKCMLKGCEIEGRGRSRLYESQLSACVVTGGNLSARTRVKFVEDVSELWQRKPEEQQLHNWRGTKFSRCVFAWWDWTSSDLTDCKFDECVFVACLFPNGMWQEGSGRFRGCSFSTNCVLASDDKGDTAGAVSSARLIKEARAIASSGRETTPATLGPFESTLQPSLAFALDSPEIRAIVSVLADETTIRSLVRRAISH